MKVGLFGPDWKPLLVKTSPLLSFAGGVDDKPDSFDSQKENNPEEFINKLPSELSFSKRVGIRFKALFVPGVHLIDRIPLSKERRAEHYLAAGKLNDFLKARLEESYRRISETEKEGYQYTLTDAYLELGRQCIHLANSRAWVLTATDKQIKDKAEYGRYGAVIAVYPEPLHTRTEAFFKSLQSTKLNFSAMAQNLYEAAMKQFKPRVHPMPAYRREEAPYLEEAGIHSQFGHDYKAITVLKKGITQVAEQRSQIELRTMLAQILESNQDYSGSLEHREWLLQNIPTYLNNNKHNAGYIAARNADLAVVYAQLNNLDAAINYVKEAIRLDSNNSYLLSHLPEQYGKTYTDFLGRLMVMKDTGNN